jgi:putative ABC transport system permease protein
MKQAEYAKMAFRNLVRTKGRAVLTMLGIVIGVASVIMMLSVGQATERYILSQVASFGSDLIIVTNGRGDAMQSGGPDPTLKQTLTENDYRKLHEKEWVRLIDANIISRETVTYENTSAFADVVGVSPDSDEIFNMVAERGSFIEDEDMSLRSRVAVLGNGIADDYFGLEDPLGKRIKIHTRSYRVIGVLKKGGTKFFQSIDRQIYIPFTTALQEFGKENVNFMFLKSTHGNLEDAKQEVRLVLRDAHNLNNPRGILAKDDFLVRTQEDAQENAEIIGTILAILLSAIAAVSLVVGGIGIMNIMYVTVKERTREIGLRKAVGAKHRDILSQFLLESFIITLMGGVAGIAVGVFLSWLGLFILAYFQQGWTYVTPWGAVALGFTVSAIIGITFGYLPARKAAKLQAIEALRYE